VHNPRIGRYRKK
jgi:hypothetical protein